MPYGHRIQFLFLIFLLAFLLPACRTVGDDDDGSDWEELEEIGRGMGRLKIGGGRLRRRNIRRNLELLEDNFNLPSNLVRERGGGAQGPSKTRFVHRRGSFSAPPIQRNKDRTGKVVLNKYKKMRDKRKFDYVKNVNKGEWDVYLNTYHMSSRWNRMFGKVLPALHGAVEFRGPGWPEGGREFSYEVGSNFEDRISEKRPRQFGEYQFHKSKYMGKTKMNPKQVRRYVQELREKKYKPDSYHITRRNCNHCAKDILKKTVGIKPPAKVNRLARGFGKLGLNRIDWFG